MKILFVASGSATDNSISSFIRSQGDSLQNEGLQLEYFTVKGKGISSYLKSIGELRRHLQESNYDVIHAHYSFCGWVAVLASGKIPVVLSLMGTDVYGKFLPNGKVSLKSRLLTSLARLIQPFVSAIITKSPNLEKAVFRKNISHIIPNGVRLDQFQIIPNGLRKELGLLPDKKYVLFLGSPKNTRKNYKLAEEAVKILGMPDVELLNVFQVPHDMVVKYFNAVDVFVLCSYAEGSPNAVKEAMACNCPMVVTNVGDTSWLVGDTPGCYISSHDKNDFAEKLSMALDFSRNHGRTRGRDRIIELGLDAKAVAQSLIKIYADVSKNHLLPQPL